MFDLYFKKSSNSLLSRHSTCPIPESNFTMRVKNHRCAPTGNCSHKPSEYMRDAIFQLSQLKKRKIKKRRKKIAPMDRRVSMPGIIRVAIARFFFLLLSFSPKNSNTIANLIRRKEKTNYTREILM